MLLRVALLALLLSAPAAAAPWRIDPGTAIVVDVAWRGSTVEVRFPDLQGSIDFDERRPEAASARIQVATTSATTGLAPVDRMLRSPDFLASGAHPFVTFELERLVQTSSSTADAFGRITLRGVTRPVTFAAQVVRYGPAADDPDRFEAGFDLTGRIDRRDFGSTAGYPDIAAELPIRIRLLMSSQ
jgi:polyisoprenoid-binding protein YceI